ncbi:MAG: cyclic nucleotide-binding domain-containing protein [Oligoflexales bacterium]
MKMTGEQVVKLGSGQVVFEQNAPGGDLYIVESGEVLLQREWAGKVTEEIVGRSGILSGLTCLTNEPRWHKAKTKNGTVLRKIRWETLQRYVQAMPHWLKKLLLFYSDSIQSSYLEKEVLLKKIETLEKTQLTIWYSIKQVLSVFLDLYTTSAHQGRDRCYISDLEKRGVEVLCFDLKMMREYTKILIESGILLTHRDSDHGKAWVKIDQVDRLLHLQKICQSFKQISVELKKSPPPRILRVVSALLIYTHKMELSQEEKVSLVFSEMKEALQGLMGHEVSVENLEEAQEYKMITLERNQDGIKIRMIPNSVGIQVSCYSALKLMEKNQRSEERNTES